MKKLDEQAIDKIFRVRMNVKAEWPQEAISEADDEWWEELIELASDWSDAPADRVLSLEIDAGHMVLKRIVNSCTPREEE